VVEQQWWPLRLCGRPALALPSEHFWHPLCREPLLPHQQNEKKNLFFSEGLGGGREPCREAQHRVPTKLAGKILTSLGPPGPPLTHSLLPLATGTKCRVPALACQQSPLPWPGHTDSERLGVMDRVSMSWNCHSSGALDWRWFFLVLVII
jgi:hypothetical protein